MAFKTGALWKGNSKGRPKHSESMPDYVKAKTQGGRALIDYYVGVLKDDQYPIMARLYACDKLVERAFGKAPQTIEGDKPENSGITLVINRTAANVAKGSKLDEVFTVRQIEPPKENDVTEAETVETPAKPST